MIKIILSIAVVATFLSLLFLVIGGFKFARAEPKEGLQEFKESLKMSVGLLLLAGMCWFLNYIN